MIPPPAFQERFEELFAYKSRALLLFLGNSAALPLNPTDSRTEQSRNRLGFGAALPRRKQVVG